MIPFHTEANMAYTPTALRKNLYTVLDTVLETGIPAVIKRHGKYLKIIPESPVSRLDRLVPHPCVEGDSSDLPDIHWDTLWSQEQDI